MPIKVSEIVDLVEHNVVVQVDLEGDDSDETYREVTGRLLAAGPQGVVVQSKTTTEIIVFADILDIEEVEVRSGKVIRRMVAALKPSSRNKLAVRILDEVEMIAARQHLADRHAYPMNLLAGTTDEMALAIHAGLDHSNLGHIHAPADTGLVCSSCGYVKEDREDDLLHKIKGPGDKYHCDACVDHDEFNYEGEE